MCIVGCAPLLLGYNFLSELYEHPDRLKSLERKYKVITKVIDIKPSDNLRQQILRSITKKELKLKDYIYQGCAIFEFGETDSNKVRDISTELHLKYLKCENKTLRVTNFKRKSSNKPLIKVVYVFGHKDKRQSKMLASKIKTDIEKLTWM